MPRLDRRWTVSGPVGHALGLAWSSCPAQPIAPDQARQDPAGIQIVLVPNPGRRPTRYRMSSFNLRTSVKDPDFSRVEAQ